MRKLQAKDVFTALRLVKKAGVKDELLPYIQKIVKEEEARRVKVANEETEAVDLEELKLTRGVEVVFHLFEIFSTTNSEACIYEFLAGPMEMEASEVATLDIGILADNLTILASENDLKVFFTQLAGLITKKHSTCYLVDITI